MFTYGAAHVHRGARAFGGVRQRLLQATADWVGKRHVGDDAFPKEGEIQAPFRAVDELVDYRRCRWVCILP